MFAVRPAWPGKTTLAGIVANEMGVNLRITSGPAIEKPGDLAALLTNLSPGDVLFIDEVHRLPRTVEEILYPAMEDYALDIITGKRADGGVLSSAAAAFHADRRHDPGGPAFRPSSGPVRRSAPAGAYSPEELGKIVLRSAGLLHTEIEADGGWKSLRVHGDSRLRTGS